MVNLSLPSRTRGNVIRLAVLVLVVALLIPTVVSAFTHTPVGIQPGTIEERPDGRTLISAQGFEERTATSSQKVTRVVSVSPGGLPQWTFRRSSGVRYFYDIDPLANGDVLISAGHPNSSFIRYDPDAGERVWTERLDTDDTHDVDLINGDELLVADMRNYNGSADRNDDRIFVYNRTRDEIVWEFRFERIYNESDGGDYEDDWTHVNDVDKIGDGLYMASPRNMDQVVVINRSTKAVEMRLGSDGDHDVMHEQHNPQYFEGPNGTPTILVADSENDRVVEYARTDGTWERTWTLGTGGKLNWPRDADRLPNGNTLVTDSLNHRVIEVTPEGQVVWEAYVSWGTYDAERVAIGEEPGGPTIRQQGASGAYEVNGSAQLTAGASDRPTFADVLSDTFAGTPISAEVDWFATRWSHIIPWIRPVWMSPWAFVSAATAVLVLLGWGGAELVVRRRRIADRARSLHPRLRRNLRSDGAGGATESADATASDADGADED
jgi:hypothetical protein